MSKYFSDNRIFVIIFVGILLIFSFIALKEKDISPIPSKAVMFFNSRQCPQGWEELKEGQGRYVVGLVKDGTLMATVGEPLLDKENRVVGKHTHSVKDPGHSHNLTIAGPFDGNLKAIVGGSSKTTTIREIDSARTNIIIEEAGSVDGTNAPYIQLLICEKQ
ncbi:MAG: hypothetical protein ACK4NF_02040 [Planctomycetota bacterium]